MKYLGFLSLLTLLVACDPWGFGYKRNPAWALNEAFNAMLGENPEAFNEVTGKEALCLYGNPEGLAYLKAHVTVKDPREVEIEPKLIEGSDRWNKYPAYVGGFWSYYTERYTVSILDKKDNKEVLKVLSECHYGDETKDDKFLGRKAKKYKKKECRIIKIMPKDFAPLPMHRDCENLSVKL